VPEIRSTLAHDTTQASSTIAFRDEHPVANLQAISGSPTDRLIAA